MNRIEILKYFLRQPFRSDGENDGLDNNFLVGGAGVKGGKYKWTTLRHHGPKFEPPFVKQNVPIIYDGKEIILSKDAEEVALLYARYNDSEYIHNNTFNKNFFNDWKKILGNDSPIKSLDLCDFSLMKQHLDDQKEKLKNEKLLNKDVEKEDDNSYYKEVLIDGKIQEISNYKIEPIGIFIGRGLNKNLGKIKRRIYPEDITLNLGKEESVPELPDFLKGHKFGKIICDKKAEWLASWDAPVINKKKYMWLSNHSDMKTIGDQAKFLLAQKLKKKIKHIREVNDKNLFSDNLQMRQIATALYFIDHLGLRVGNENDNTADTVGISNLRIEHINLESNNEVVLNFLSKDSVEYFNTVKVDPIVYKNLKEFAKDKKKGDELFDKINSSDINEYLQEFMKGLTAKVFRTYNGSNLFQKEIMKISKKYEGTEGHEKEILDAFLRANLIVAKLLNHKKNIATGYKTKVDNISGILDKLKKKLAKAKRSKKKNPKTIEQLKEKINNYKSKKEITKDMRDVSLDTSKANYVDPKILVSFMKRHKLDVNKIFSKALQKKFSWAFDVDENYKF